MYEENRKDSKVYPVMFSEPSALSHLQTQLFTFEFGE